MCGSSPLGLWSRGWAPLFSVLPPDQAFGHLQFRRGCWHAGNPQELGLSSIALPQSPQSDSRRAAWEGCAYSTQGFWGRCWGSLAQSSGYSDGSARSTEHPVREGWVDRGGWTKEFSPLRLTQGFPRRKPQCLVSPAHSQNPPSSDPDLKLGGQ